VADLSARLRHRVEFQAQTTVRDSEGRAVTTWETAALDSGTPLDLVPAEVLTGPGREFVESGQKQATTAARIVVRWFPALSPSWRILWDGRTYGIETAETDITGRREWRIRCTEGANDGQ
jgi:SPP1 family predicted phage head-tail adaptor